MLTTCYDVLVSFEECATHNGVGQCMLPRTPLLPILPITDAGFPGVPGTCSTTAHKTHMLHVFTPLPYATGPTTEVNIGEDTGRSITVCLDAATVMC